MEPPVIAGIVLLMAIVTIGTHYRTAYVWLFVSLSGFASLSDLNDISRQGAVVRDTGILWLWIPMFLLGLFVLGLRTRAITDPHVRSTMIFADLLIVITELMVVILVPDFLGLVKTGIVAVVAAAYLSDLYKYAPHLLFPE